MKLIGLLLVAAVILPGLVAAASAGTSQGPVLTDLDGKKTPLNSLLAKGPVVLNFWATWCGPCRAEMPQLQKVYQELDAKGVRFAAISLDRGLSKDALVQFLKGRGIVMPVYRDEDAALAKKFGVVAIPTTFVLARSGEVFYSTKGYRPGDEVMLRKKIEELIALEAKPKSKQPAKP